MEEQLGKYEKADVNTDMTDRRDEVLRDVQEAIDDAIGILSRANEGEGRNEMQRTYMGILESPVEDIEGIIRMIPE